MHIIFLDFEGLQAEQNDAPHDSKMFALAVLLSSMICFNSKTQFEEKTLDELSLCSDLHRYIKIRAPQGLLNRQATVTPGYGRDKKKPKPRKSVGGEAGEASNKQMLSQIMPKLLWLIRDSKIYFQDEDGK